MKTILERFQKLLEVVVKPHLLMSLDDGGDACTPLEERERQKVELEIDEKKKVIKIRDWKKM